MLKSRSQEFAPLCHLPDVIAISFIWVHTASNICYHSSTEGQTDLFFAHSSVNHTESHLLNTSADFPPDILLYWHLNWKSVVANMPRNFREYKEEQKQFFLLKAVEKQCYMMRRRIFVDLIVSTTKSSADLSQLPSHETLCIIWSGSHHG